MGEQLRATIEERRYSIKGATIFTLIGMIIGGFGVAFGAGSAFGGYDIRLAAVEKKVEEISGSIADLEAVRTNIEWLVRRSGGQPVQTGGDE